MPAPPWRWSNTYWPWDISASFTEQIRASHPSQNREQAAAGAAENFLILSQRALLEEL